MSGYFLWGHMMRGFILAHRSWVCSAASASGAAGHAAGSPEGHPGRSRRHCNGAVEAGKKASLLSVPIATAKTASARFAGGSQSGRPEPGLPARADPQVRQRRAQGPVHAGADQGAQGRGAGADRADLRQHSGASRRAAMPRERPAARSCSASCASAATASRPAATRPFPAWPDRSCPTCVTSITRYRDGTGDAQQPADVDCHGEPEERRHHGARQHTCPSAARMPPAPGGKIDCHGFLIGAPAPRVQPLKAVRYIASADGSGDDQRTSARRCMNGPVQYEKLDQNRLSWRPSGGFAAEAAA